MMSVMDTLTLIAVTFVAGAWVGSLAVANLRRRVEDQDLEIDYLRRASKVLYKDAKKLRRVMQMIRDGDVWKLQ